MLSWSRLWEAGDVSYSQSVEQVDDIESIKPTLVQPFDLNHDALFRIRIFSAPQNNYLFFDIHHIIFDAYSCRMILNELSRAYDGESLAEEEFSGFDVAMDEQRRREGEEYCEAKLWHESSYDGVDVDSSPIADQKEEARGIGKESLALYVKDPEVKAFCKANGVGRSAFFNAAFAYFLAAYNNSPDALYATVYAGRGDVRCQRTLSMMVKTLTLYQNVSRFQTVKELVSSVATQLNEATHHDLFSFVEASAQFGFTGSLMFAYQGDIYLDGIICGEAARLEDLRENGDGETLQLYKSGESFYIECEFRRARYSNKLIRELLLSFNRVLSEMLQKEMLADINLIGESQIEELEAFNQTAVEYDRSLTIIDLIGRRAEEAPESLAVVYKEQRYTYSELEKISDNIANNILGRGLQSEDVVAILIPRSEYMAIAPLGVAKSGCTYQPLDHTYPTERLEFMLEDSAAKLLIADESLLPLVPNYRGEVLLTTDIAGLPDMGRPNTKVNPTNAFNLLYTSGSTGLPKGCIIEHRNIAAFVHLCRNIYGLTPEDNTTAYASFGFDASMWETFMSLCWGCTLHIIAEDIRLNLIDLEKYFVENDITVSFMTTQVGRQFALSVGETKLRHFSTGGEKLAALDPPTAFTLHNCYGPTEATVFVTHYPLTRKESNIPIGKTVENIITSVRKIIDLNPYLLCRFESNNGEVVQRISKEDYATPHLTLNREEFESFKEVFVKPYNLSKDTLFRVACVECDEANYLFMDFHHLIFDGASCDLFIAQLNRLLSGEEMESNGYSYFNYIDDEREAESSRGYQESAEYFDSRLQLCEGGTEIPVELNKNRDDAALAVEEIVVTSGDGVEAFCKSQGVSPAQFYLSASLYTISRFANTKDVFISTISNGRSNIKTAYTFGMMVKTLPIASFVREQSVAEFIHETAADFEATISHENYPYAKLAADYHFSPEIMYAYQVGVLNEYKARGEAVGFETLELKSPKFKLSIHIESREGRDAIVLEYNDALYSSYFMSQLARSMDSVVSRFIESESALVKSISIVSREQSQELERFHTVAQEMGHISYYHSGLERYAKETPSQMALMARDAHFSYEELNGEANRVANALISRGVAIGDRVAILLPRTSRLIISMYGVSKSGAAYIPCDVEYPKERIDHVLEDSNAKYVITTKERVGEFARGVAVDIEELLLESNVENPSVEFSVDELAYIIYTSGSTGKPKGVLLMHKGISNYTFNHPANRHVHALVNDATKYLSVTTISFDMSLKEIAITIANGLTLILADESEANNPILLTKLFELTGADALNATPSRMLQYMEYDGFCEVLSRCKIIMSGGEKFSAQLLSRLKTITSGRIFNTYGPTEITVSSNARELTNDDKITIGQPLLNYTEFVVDSDGNELPPCVVGELYIGGVGVAKGYNNLEEMTRERFINYNGVEVYRSGDYASWDEMGNVSILGRTDNQVKLRGLRIELGEIESAISKFDGVKSVVAIIKEIKGKEHIAAYYTAGNTIDVMELKEEISKGLAAYMVPTAYLQMDALPQTPNGKTDVKSLPEANLLAVSGGEEAANSVEQSFCDMFASILNIESVGATDNFFEIGGSSLVATRLIIESSKLGYDVAYGDIFEHPTPRELALLVGGGAEAESDKGESEYDDIVKFDYNTIQPVLDANTIESFQSGELREPQRVLLVGTTGFLGIHILKELLDREGVTIYCLLRGRDGVSAEQRLKTMLFYYFEQTYEELLAERLFVIDGDFGNFSEIEIPEVDTVINCAAIVKHFAKGNEIYDVNVGGVEKLIDLCVERGARLIHVSTMSVNGFATYPQPSSQFKERELYKGQYINNKYIHSKFLAERAILEAIATRSLDAKIMRVGNLSARNSDGEFQINFNTNSFMNRLKVFNVLGVCPYEELDSLVEFSPIDEVAQAILLLSTTPRECCIFHPYNNHSIFKGDIFSQMAHLGINVRPVEMSEYLARIDAVKSDVEMAQNLTSIIAYENMGNGREITPHIKSNSQTMQILYRMNYRWSPTSWDYIERFVEVLLGFGYFNE